MISGGGTTLKEQMSEYLQTEIFSQISASLLQKESGAVCVARAASEVLRCKKP